MTTKSKKQRDPIASQIRKVGAYKKISSLLAFCAFISGGCGLGAMLNDKQNTQKEPLEDPIVWILVGSTIGLFGAYKTCTKAYGRAINQLQQMMDQECAKNRE